LPEGIVALITIILLGLILATLICMMLVFLGAIVNIQKHSESINGHLSGILETINKLSDRTADIIDSVTNIYNISIDMKYHQKKLREQEMTTAIEKLTDIDLKASDLKNLNETLLTLKESLDKINAHPAVAKHYEEANPL
jgi:hypothetical protein